MNLTFFAGLAAGMMIAAAIGLLMAWNNWLNRNPDGYTSEEMRLWNTI